MRNARGMARSTPASKLCQYYGLPPSRQQHKLTPAGQVLYDHAREILRLCEDVKARLKKESQP